MTNPWLKKNPFMSMWLSGANAAVGSTRGRIVAESRRQSQIAITKATSDIFGIWIDAMTASTPKRRTRR